MLSVATNLIKLFRFWLKDEGATGDAIVLLQIVVIYSES